MLTEQERSETMTYVALENSLKLSYIFLWFPACVFFYVQFRRDPVKYAHNRFKILISNMIQLPALIWAMSKRDAVVDKMERKYLNDLTDYEI